MPARPLTRREILKLAALLPLAASPLLVRRPISGLARTSPERPNILILVFDALSAYHVSSYGYQRPTTPNLDRFAGQATVFHNHIAGGNFTTSGTTTLLTGAYPWSHRALHIYGQPAETWAEQNIFTLFRQAGYFTASYTHNMLAELVLNRFRSSIDRFTLLQDLCLSDFRISDTLLPRDVSVFTSGELRSLMGDESAPPSSMFSALVVRLLYYYNERRLNRTYRPRFPRGLPNQYGASFIMEDAIDWILEQAVSLSQPYLAYYHLLPPHGPYNPRRDFIGRFNGAQVGVEKPGSMFSSGRNLAALENERRKYDEFLAYADAEFGRLMETLAERGDLENTIFIFVSDHGELFERGIIGHTTAGLYHPVIQVPLMIRLPGQKTRQDIYTPTSNTDLLPTLLHLTGQAVPGWCEGQVLPPWQTSASADRPIFSVEAKSSPFQGPLVKRSISMVSGEYKLVHYHGYEEAPDRWELYDLAEDPEELRELTSASPEVTRRLQERLLAEFQSAEHRNNNT